MRRKASEIKIEADSDALFCELDEDMASEIEKLTISDAFYSIYRCEGKERCVTGAGAPSLQFAP